MKGYIGCYQSENNEHNLIQFNFDEASQRFDHFSLALNIRDAKYLALDGTLLYTIGREDKSGVYRIDLEDNSVSHVFMENSTACYIDSDDKYVYTANYHDGCVYIYLKDSSLAFVKRLDMGLKAGCHQVVSYCNYIFVPCLLLDKIYIYDVNNDFKLVGNISFEKGAGPRHCVIRNSYLYVISELSNEILEFDIKAMDSIRLLRHINLLDEHEKGSSAAIRLSLDCKFLYVSIRDLNVIKVIDIEKLSVIQTVSSGGDHPRDIALSPDGNFLFIVNRYSDNCVVYTVNTYSGMCEEIVDTYSVKQGVSIVFQE